MSQEARVVRGQETHRSCGQPRNGTGILCQLLTTALAAAPELPLTQQLTGQTGRPGLPQVRRRSKAGFAKLCAHLGSVVSIMKLSIHWNDFEATWTGSILHTERHGLSQCWETQTKSSMDCPPTRLEPRKRTALA
jgi:hypothetical protein